MATRLAQGLSLLALGMGVAGVVGGIAMAFLGRRSPLLVVLGLALCAGSVAALPRRPGSDATSVQVPEGTIPELASLLSRVGGELGIEAPAVVAVDLSAGASIQRIGRRRSALTIGAPLWASLDGQERLALLAHEMGHVAAGDPRRGHLVGLGMGTLARWWYALVPPPTMHDGSIGRWLGHVTFAALRGVVAAWMRLIARLALRGVQIAEVRADRASVRIAGYHACDRLLHHLNHSGPLVNATRLAAARRDDIDFYESIRHSMSTIPAMEEERLRRLAAMEPYGRNASHPPPRLRRLAIEDLREVAATITVDEAESDRIDAELSGPFAALASAARRAVDQQRDPVVGRHQPRNSS